MWTGALDSDVSERRDNDRFERFLNIAWKQADEDKSGALDVCSANETGCIGRSIRSLFDKNSFFFLFFSLSLLAGLLVDRMRSQITELGDTLDVFFNSDANDKPLSKDEIAALVARFDKDGSKTVTKDEFRTIIKEFLAANSQ